MKHHLLLLLAFLLASSGVRAMDSEEFERVSISEAGPLAHLRIYSKDYEKILGNLRYRFIQEDLAYLFEKMDDSLWPEGLKKVASAPKAALRKYEAYYVDWIIIGDDWYHILFIPASRNQKVPAPLRPSSDLAVLVKSLKYKSDEHSTINLKAFGDPVKKRYYLPFLTDVLNTLGTNPTFDGDPMISMEEIRKPLVPKMFMDEANVCTTPFGYNYFEATGTAGETLEDGKKLLGMLADRLYREGKEALQLVRTDSIDEAGFPLIKLKGRRYNNVPLTLWLSLYAKPDLTCGIRYLVENNTSEAEERVWQDAGMAALNELAKTSRKISLVQTSLLPEKYSQSIVGGYRSYVIRWFLFTNDPQTKVDICASNKDKYTVKPGEPQAFSNLWYLTGSTSIDSFSINPVITTSRPDARWALYVGRIETEEQQRKDAWEKHRYEELEMRWVTARQKLISALEKGGFKFVREEWVDVSGMYQSVRIPHYDRTNVTVLTSVPNLNFSIYKDDWGHVTSLIEQPMADSLNVYSLTLKDPIGCQVNLPYNGKSYYVRVLFSKYEATLPESKTNP